jgi:hypothetical protein
MRNEKKIEKANLVEINDPYTSSIIALKRDLDDKIESTRRELEYLEKLRRDLDVMSKRQAA